MKIKHFFLYFVLLLTALLTSCGQEPTEIIGCEKVGELQPICQFTNPEDIETLPDGKTLLISQMGTMEGDKPGSLALYNTETGQTENIFLPRMTTTGSDNWGQSTCLVSPGEAFAPHGTSLTRRNDTRWQLAVVNHGGHDSVEMFEVLQIDNQITLQWRGCIIPPDGTFMNDVALLKNGGFIASHMFDKHAPVVFGLSTGLWKAQLGINTGHVFEWVPHKPDDFRILEGSHGPFINGVEISADNKTVFANVYVGNEIRKIDRATGGKLGSVDLPQTDNLSWDESGYLLAASHTGSKMDQMHCMKRPGKTCPFEFTISAIDPDSLEVKTVLKHSGAPMGAGTVARHLYKHIYIGSFTGDRILKVPYESPFK